MSLLSSKRVDVVISADFYEVIVCTTGFNNKVLLQRAKNFSLSRDNNASFASGLTETLLQLTLKPNTPLSIYLMSDHVQYTSLPAQLDSMTAQDQHRYAKAAFEQLFGEVAQNWEVAIQEAPPFCPMVCAAIQNELLNKLQNIAEQTQLKLHTIAPFVNAVVDAFQKEIRHVSGYLTVVEQNRILLMQLRNGRPLNVSVDVIEENDWDFVLMQMLTRARLTATGEQKKFQQVLIHAPLIKLTRQERLNSQHLQGWKIQWLTNSQLFDLKRPAIKETLV